MLRLSENWKNGDRLLTENLIEGLNLRYRHLSSLKDIDGSQAPLSLEQTLVFSAVDLNISIQELIVVP
jgi:phage FluMu protein gp41